MDITTQDNDNFDVTEDDVLTVTTHAESGGPVVVAQGDVDLCTTATLREALDLACGSLTSPGTVAVDMREVPFIDSAGLALLVEMRKRHYDKCEIALIIQSGSQPERVLKLGRFDTFLKVGYSSGDVLAVAPGG